MISKIVDAVTKKEFGQWYLIIQYRKTHRKGGEKVPLNINIQLIVYNFYFLLNFQFWRIKNYHSNSNFIVQLRWIFLAFRWKLNQWATWKLNWVVITQRKCRIGQYSKFPNTENWSQAMVPIDQFKSCTYITRLIPDKDKRQCLRAKRIN